jgi:hypothetical protein
MSGSAARGSVSSNVRRMSSWKIALLSQAARSPWVRAAMRWAASMVASWPAGAK